MPLPKPKKNESKDAFVSRCIEKASAEFPRKQALAVCFEKYDASTSAAAETKTCCDACASGHTCSDNHTTSSVVISFSESTPQTFAFAAKVIEETIAGVKYLSFPIIMAVEGVRQAANSPAPELILRSVFEPAIKKQQAEGIKKLNASADEDYVDDDEKKSRKKKSTKDWQLPLVYLHPQRGREYVSVHDKHDASTGKILGYIDNIRFEGTKLVGQAHMSMKLVEKAGEDAILQASRIKAKNLVEVSLGHSAVVLPVSGKFKGKSFYGVHMSPMLDHLAILGPGQRGACGVKQSEGGCGAPRE